MKSLSYLTDQYYQHHKSLQSRPNTITWHKNTHRLFFKLCDIQNIEDIDRESIRRFIFLKSQEGRSPDTIRTHIRSIKAFYKWLVEEEYVEKNIFQKKILLPRMEEKPPKLISRMDLRKISRILEVYPYYRDLMEKLRTKTLFSLYMHTGMRKMEALRIKMEHLNLKERRILICVKVKTHDYRNVIINDELHEILKEYCMYLKEKEIKNEYLFFNSDPKLPMSDGSLKLIKNKIQVFGRRRYKIKNFTLNMFRHSYISYAIADRISIPFIMNQVGHTQITTTQGYTHSPQKEMQASLSVYSPLRGSL